MRKALIAVATVIAAVGVTVIAVPAANADFRSVKDPRGDTGCNLHCTDQKMRNNADIIRVTAGHEGGRLKHTIRVVGKIHKAALFINTHSDRYCDQVLWISRRGERSVDSGGCLTPHTDLSRARVDFHHHSVDIFFSKRLIGNPDSYGWKVYVSVVGETARATPGRRHRGGVGRGASDLAPNKGPWGWIPHQLGR